MRNTILTLSVVLGLGLGACDDSAKQGDAKGKSETAKKDVKGDAKAKRAVPDRKADAKSDAKSDAKADAKADAEVDEPTDAEPKAGDDEVEKIGQLAALARQIAAKPEEADAILEKAGMDRAAFESAMVAVAKDQWKTDLYVTALTQADAAAPQAG